MRARRAAILHAAALAAAIAVSQGATAARAQGLDLGGGSDEPVEITADDGIEWHRDEEKYVARGNATAVRAGVKVRADTLTAFYHPVKGGGTDIYRLDAVGNVVITSQDAKVVGDNGVYDVKNGVLVLKGGALKMTSKDYTVTARDSLEYWNSRQMAVARGGAQVVSADRNVKANIVTAYFYDDKTPRPAPKDGKEQSDIRLMEAFQNVQITSPGQLALADKGVYDVESGIARLYGSVKITREDNQLNGDYGEVNLNSGVSRMLAGPPGTEGHKPVRALFSTKRSPQIGPKDEAPAPPAAAANVPTQAPAPTPLPYPDATPNAPAP